MKYLLLLILLPIVIVISVLIKNLILPPVRSRCRIGLHHKQNCDGNLVRWYCYDHREEFFAGRDEVEPVCPGCLKDEIIIGGNNDLTRTDNKQRK